MAATLYLIKTRARSGYSCAACSEYIPSGSTYFRHDPHPYARIFRDQQRAHFCWRCIEASAPAEEEFTHRFRVPALRVLGAPHAKSPGTQLELQPVRVELLGIGRALSEQLVADASLVHGLTPDQFEEFICDRIYAMGFDVRRVGAVNQPDGGVDVVFWPRGSSRFPILGAAKHHRDPTVKQGPAVVREFAGVLAGHPFNAGLLVTNTSFTPDAQWFAREKAKLIRLRGLTDIRRWLVGNFSDDAEWREIPREIEVCPGVIVRIR
jgi:hypothetical protein